MAIYFGGIPYIQLSDDLNIFSAKNVRMFPQLRPQREITGFFWNTVRFTIVGEIGSLLLKTRQVVECRGKIRHTIPNMAESLYPCNCEICIML